MASTFCDIDDIFAYQTPKVVVVRDRYLGLLKLFFLAGIIAYVLVTLLTSDPPGYVTTAAPVGLISKLTLQRPPNRVFDSRNMTYCSDYLNTTGQGPSQYRDQCECLVWDEGDAQFPIDLPNSLFVTTRATIGQQERLCGVKATHNCATPWSNRADSNPPPSYYTLGIDEFTVLVQHSFRGGPWDPAGMSSLRMDGSLTAANGTVVKEFPYDPNNLIGDIMSIDELLDAAGVDMRRSSSTSSGVAHSVRYAGVILLLEVQYVSQTVSAPFAYTYTYRVAEINSPNGYKATEVENNPANASQRLVTDRHGVKLFFVFSGALQKFDTVQLLIHLVTSLGLLSVANIIVDSVMTSIMPRRQWYKDCKYQTTVDFDAVGEDRLLREKLFSVGNPDALAARHAYAVETSS